MAEEILASVQVRRDSKANWESVNPILLNGEAAYEQDTDMFKIGDGVKRYSDLPYHNKVGPQGPQGEPGPTPQISMNVSTGNPGTSASVSVTGTAENPVINLTVPRGDTGETGSTGPKGDTGSSGVYIGTTQPTDSNINVWIDSDGEPTEVIDDFAREEIGSLKDDIIDQKQRTEPVTARSDDDNQDSLYVTDGNGYVICKVNASGVQSTAFGGKSYSAIDEYDNALYVTDETGNVIVKINKNGVRGVGIPMHESQYEGVKLLTYGDSLSAHDGWAKYLVKWLGFSYDLDETLNGAGGHACTAKGGTMVDPSTGTDSIYMRMLDAKYYVDDVNGTCIMIYAGANDDEEMGTIDDTPYTDRSIPTERPTFYASYMGMIENLLADVPQARIILVTQMTQKYDIGSTYFPTEEDAEAYEKNKVVPKVEAVKAIAGKYRLPVIDLYNGTGVTLKNMGAYYGAAVNGRQVHCNACGYKRMAETMVQQM